MQHRGRYRISTNYGIDSRKRTVIKKINNARFVIENKERRPSDNALTILIFLLVSYLRKTIKRPRPLYYDYIDGFLIEQNIIKDGSGKGQYVLSKRYLRGKKIYKLYYDSFVDSKEANPQGKCKIILYHILPDPAELPFS